MLYHLYVLYVKKKTNILYSSIHLFNTYTFLFKSPTSLPSPFSLHLMSFLASKVDGASSAEWRQLYTGWSQLYWMEPALLGGIYASSNFYLHYSYFSKYHLSCKKCLNFWLWNGAGFWNFEGRSFPEIPTLYKYALGCQHWENSKTGSLAKLVANTNFRRDHCICGENNINQCSR